MKEKSLTFAKIEPIAALWDDYSSRLSNSENAVAKMDLHGAKISIVASRDPSFVGVKGRVVKETFGMLTVISQDDSIRQIPKNFTTVSIETSKGNFELNLTGFRCKPHLRVSKRWKQRYSVPLPY